MASNHVGFQKLTRFWAIAGLILAVVMGLLFSVTSVQAGGLASMRQDGANAVSTYANIGDRVWYDTDGQGDQDGGEVGINGVTVKLYSGVCGPSGSPIQTKVTSGDGAYLFTNVLYNRSYCVVVDTTTVP